MVGDKLSADILGASKAGLYSIWITRRADIPANQAFAAEIIPDATIATLSELPGLLEYLT
jgi:FMN phosphatase YigB (HAD superfamily)